MAALRGKSPDPSKKRLKLFLFGPPGTGKTMAAIQFPRPYVMDCERGSENDEYAAKIKAVGGAYFQPADLDDVLAEVRNLLGTQHEYRTIVIDPITVPYLAAVDAEAIKIGTEFGRNKIAPDRTVRNILTLLYRHDMNVVVTAHRKANWKQVGTERVQDGDTFDGYSKLDYVFDLVLKSELRGKDKRVARVEKSRLSGFPMAETIDLSYDEIANRYGREMLERDAKPVELASPEQQAEAANMASALRIDAKTIDGWFNKADATGWADMPAESVAKCIAWMKKKLSEPRIESVAQEVSQ